MKFLKLPMPLRRALAWGYLLLALGAPLMVLLLPGEPPLSVNDELLQLESGRFVNPKAALGMGAEKYDENVLNDLPGIVASAAADYPDGSNAVLALFGEAGAAGAALETLKGMIPHQDEEKDLWSTHFASESGEYVLLAHSGRVLVMVISERESMARDRLAALPALNYNPHPGLGALLQQQSPTSFMLIMVFYIVVQWLFVRLLLSWAGMAAAKPVVDEEGEAG